MSKMLFFLYRYSFDVSNCLLVIQFTHSLSLSLTHQYISIHTHLYIRCIQNKYAYCTHIANRIKWISAYFECHCQHSCLPLPPVAERIPEKTVRKIRRPVAKTRFGIFSQTHHRWSSSVPIDNTASSPRHDG